MPYSCEKNIPENISKAFIDGPKALKTLKLSDWSFWLHSSAKKCINVFPLQAMALFGCY